MIRSVLLSALAAASALGWVSPVSGQTPAEASLDGTVFVGDSTMKDGTVVLHRLSEGSQGELDSVAVASDGTFDFPLPNVPDPSRSDVFFASVRHHGVLYFGPAITSAVQLDSIYEIHAYDTILAPAQGLSVPLQSRSVFFEPDSAGWRVTDLFQVRNDESRTIVARQGGRVWGHPLPEAAREVTAGEGELAFDAARYEDGELVVRAALPPGERLFVVRYRLDEATIDIPTAGPTESMDVLIREPAPPLEVEGLEPVDRIELEAGSTYMRYSGTDVGASDVRIVQGEESSRPRVEWAAVLLALVLTGAALFILRPGAGRAAAGGVGPGTGRAPGGSTGAQRGPEAVRGGRGGGTGRGGRDGGPAREDLLRQVALLDEEFEAREDASEEERQTYERRRSELIGRIRALDSET